MTDSITISRAHYETLIEEHTQMKKDLANVKTDIGIMKSDVSTILNLLQVGASHPSNTQIKGKYNSL
jgi:hypothetical protein